jgi:hypothetical protein
VNFLMPFDGTPLEDTSELSPTRCVKKNGGFDGAWTVRRTVDELGAIWLDVERYPRPDHSHRSTEHGRKEGAVQAAITSFANDRSFVIDREVTPAFEDEKHKDAFMRECESPTLDALARAHLDMRGSMRRAMRRAPGISMHRDPRRCAPSASKQHLTCGNVRFKALRWA